jgi:hypothetical protein
VLRDTRTYVGLDSLVFINCGLQIEENKMTEQRRWEKQIAALSDTSRRLAALDDKTVKEYVHEVFFTISMAALGLLWFWLFVYLVFSL